MIRTVKTLFIAGAIAIFCIPVLALAASDDVTLTTDTVISVGGYTLNVSGSSATLESIVVNSSSFDVVMQSGSSITITASGRNQLSATTDADVAETTVCNGSESSMALSATGAGTITITPSATICTTPSSGGGGGGFTTLYTPMGGFKISVKGETEEIVSRDVELELVGGSNTYLVIVSENPFLSSASSTIYKLSQGTVPFKFSESMGMKTIYAQFCSIARTHCSDIISTSVKLKYKNLTEDYQTVVVDPSQAQYLPQCGFALNADLKYGQTNDEVKFLQTFLKNHNPVIYPEGIVSGWFGPLTKRAVIRFQEAYADSILIPLGLHSGTGYVGVSTRSKIAAFCNNQNAVPKQTADVIEVPVLVFISDLSIGDQGDEVVRLQNFLKDLSHPNARILKKTFQEGVLKGYFGRLTRDALAEYQELMGISPAVGYFGPITKEVVNTELGF